MKKDGGPMVRFAYRKRSEDERIYKSLTILSDALKNEKERPSNKYRCEANCSYVVGQTFVRRSANIMVQVRLS